MRGQLIAFFIARQKMCNEDLLLIEKLRKYFLYSESEGVLYWNVSKPPVRKGTAISNLNSSGYVSMKVDGKHFYAHRAIWAIYYGEFPKGQIDHINGIKTDNRISNLRSVSNGINTFNAIRKTTTGKKGVIFRKKDDLFEATICFNGVKHYLGCSKDFDVAVAMRKAAEKKFYPDIDPRS